MTHFLISATEPASVHELEDLLAFDVVLQR
jgi:hypothetical protein